MQPSLENFQTLHEPCTATEVPQTGDASNNDNGLNCMIQAAQDSVVVTDGQVRTQIRHESQKVDLHDPVMPAPENKLSKPQ